MRIIDYFRKRRALKSFVKILPALLKKRYGKHNSYTEGQVQTTIGAAGLDERFRYYAMAMYLPRPAFEMWSQKNNNPYDYDGTRQQIADRYFGGDAGFTIHEALDAAGHTTCHNGSASDFEKIVSESCQDAGDTD